jgi:hypothetical protein
MIRVLSHITQVRRANMPTDISVNGFSRIDRWKLELFTSEDRNPDNKEPCTERIRGAKLVCVFFFIRGLTLFRIY